VIGHFERSHPAADVAKSHRGCEIVVLNQAHGATPSVALYTEGPIGKIEHRSLKERGRAA
jgi:hypothetical protein